MDFLVRKRVRPEFLNEVAGVVETYFQCDLCDRGVGMQKQRLCFFNAQVLSRRSESCRYIA